MKHLKQFENNSEEYNVGDIRIFDLNTIIHKSEYYKIIKMIQFETDYLNHYQLHDYISIEEAYKKDPKIVELAFKMLYENYEDFDMLTKRETEAVLNMWKEKIPSLRIFDEINKYNI